MGIGWSVQQMWKFSVPHIPCHIILTAVGLKGLLLSTLQLLFTDFDK